MQESALLTRQISDERIEPSGSINHIIIVLVPVSMGTYVRQNLIV
jgi:hypothetical protein